MQSTHLSRSSPRASKPHAKAKLLFPTLLLPLSLAVLSFSLSSPISYNSRPMRVDLPASTCPNCQSTVPLLLSCQLTNDNQADAFLARLFFLLPHFFHQLFLLHVQTGRLFVLRLLPLYLRLIDLFRKMQPCKVVLQPALSRLGGCRWSRASCNRLSLSLWRIRLSFGLDGRTTRPWFPWEGDRLRSRGNRFD